MSDLREAAQAVVEIDNRYARSFVPPQLSEVIDVLREALAQPPTDDRDRLAADLHGDDPTSGGPNDVCGCYLTADRLIALGWTRNMVADDAAYETGREDGLAEAVDEERPARALVSEASWTPSEAELMAAAILAALRGNTDE